MILHLVNASPWQSSALKDCITYATKEDAILLTGDGVYSCKNNDSSTAIKAFKAYVLADDLVARGIEDALPEHISAVDFQQFVELTLSYKSTMKWS